MGCELRMQELSLLASAVRLANLNGRLFAAKPSVADALQELVRRGVVVPVCATSTSWSGYVAIPGADFDALIDASGAI